MADLTITDLLAADPLHATLGGSMVLDEIRIGVRLWMNPRSFRWSIDVQDSAGRPQIEGHALTADCDVFRPYRALIPGLPGGQLYCTPAARDGSEPSGFDAWRTTHALKYRPAAEVT